MCFTINRKIITMKMLHRRSRDRYISIDHLLCDFIHSGGAVFTLNSEIFIQSKRMAALVLLGSLRWLVVGLLGFVFPFLIVSANIACFHK